MKIIIIFSLLILSEFGFSQVSPFKLDIGEPQNVTISPDNKFIAIVSGKEEVYVNLYKVNGLERYAVIRLNNNGTNTAKFSNNGQYLIVSSGDEIKIYDINTKKTNNIKIDQNTEATIVDISPDCNFVAVIHNYSAPLSPGYMSVYDIKREKKLYTLENFSYYESLKYFNKGDRIALGSEGKIQILDARYGNVTAELKSRLFLNSYMGNILLTENDSLLLSSETGNLYIWDLQSYQCNVGYQFPSIMEMALSPDNNIIAIRTGSEVNKILLWDMETKVITREIKNIVSPNSYWTPIIFSPDFKNLYWTQSNTLYRYPLSSYFSRSIPFQNFFDDYRSEVESKYKTFEVRGEFETIDEYAARSRLFMEEVNGIKQKYMNEIFAGEKMNYDKVLERGQEILDQISSSARDTVLKIDMLGEYDIDNQIMPISIKGNKKNIRMNVQDAKNLKANLNNTLVHAKVRLKTDLQSLEFYDVIIIHPTSGVNYEFSLEALR